MCLCVCGGGACVWVYSIMPRFSGILFADGNVLECICLRECMCTYVFIFIGGFSMIVFYDMLKKINFRFSSLIGSPFLVSVIYTILPFRA